MKSSITNVKACVEVVESRKLLIAMRFQELVLGIKRSEMQRLGLKEEVGLGRGMKEERDGIQALDQTLKEERREINLQAPLEMISIFLV